MNTTPSQEGALAGLKVLDLSRVLAGPWCTQILADLGADVVKIERPGIGDDTRSWGPPFLTDSNGEETDQATYFTFCNRNKRSVTIDMATPEGQALLQQMAAQSDVVVENSTAILAALEVRHRSGAGQHIDMALLDVGMAILANQASAFLNTGVAPPRQGNTHPSLAPYQDFHTKDGAMMLAIGNNGQFARFCEAADQPGLACGERFATNSLRVQHRGDLIRQLDAVMRTRTTSEWIELLEDEAVPCGPINDIAQAFEDEQVKARGLAVKLPRQAGDGMAHITSVASPLRLSATPPVLRNAAPALGQHTDEVLAQLGLASSRIAELRRAQVV